MRYLPKTTQDKVLRRIVHSPPVRKKYARSWVLMDRIHNAGDSGEILFKHIRENHPSINAWFVLEKGTADFERLRKEGYGDRLVAHGSRQWLNLMANCEHLLASHADAPVINPPRIQEFTEPQWRFTFLQHGVIKDDLSRWLNYKKIDLFVTSTVAGARLDRRRPHRLPVHHQGDRPHRPAPLRPAAAGRSALPRRPAATWCC